MQSDLEAARQRAMRETHSRARRASVAMFEATALSATQTLAQAAQDAATSSVVPRSRRAGDPAVRQQEEAAEVMNDLAAAAGVDPNTLVEIVTARRDERVEIDSARVSAAGRRRSVAELSAAVSKAVAAAGTGGLLGPDATADGGADGPDEGRVPLVDVTELAAGEDDFIGLAEAGSRGTGRQTAAAGGASGRAGTATAWGGTARGGGTASGRRGSADSQRSARSAGAGRRGSAGSGSAGTGFTGVRDGDSDEEEEDDDGGGSVAGGSDAGGDGPRPERADSSLSGAGDEDFAGHDFAGLRTGAAAAEEAGNRRSSARSGVSAVSGVGGGGWEAGGAGRPASGGAGGNRGRRASLRRGAGGGDDANAHGDSFFGGVGGGAGSSASRADRQALLGVFARPPRGLPPVLPAVTRVHLLVLNLGVSKRQQFRAFAKSYAMKVTVVTTTRDALAVLAREDARVNVVFADIAEGPDAVAELLRSMRADGVRLPVIIATPPATELMADGDSPLLRALSECASLGAAAAIEKPIAMEALAVRARVLVERSAKAAAVVDDVKLSKAVSNFCWWGWSVRQQNALLLALRAADDTFLSSVPLSHAHPCILSLRRPRAPVRHPAAAGAAQPSAVAWCRQHRRRCLVARTGRQSARLALALLCRAAAAARRAFLARWRAARCWCPARSTCLGCCWGSRARRALRRRRRWAAPARAAPASTLASRARTAAMQKGTEAWTSSG
jgi:hypothetical protein